jgi:SAM-dependent methyltransferase
VTDWDGARYQARFDELAASGADVHGEATFVRGYEPSSVLDAGCGSGRVAIELARHGVEVVGVDVNVSMLAAARATAPALTWVEADLASLELGRTFDLVVMAGNVLLFTERGTEPEVVAACARHSERLVVAGFQLDGRCVLGDYDAWCDAAGLTLVERFATWDRAPFDDGDYAVSVHRQSPGRPGS